MLRGFVLFGYDLLFLLNEQPRLESFRTFLFPRNVDMMIQAVMPSNIVSYSM